MEMKSQIEAMRGLAVITGETIDYSKQYAHSEQGKHYLNLVSLLTPIVKSWCTDQAVYITSLGIQVHGGMGFIEDTGAAQYYRDSRILPIYEGTNGIQALDLLKRKLFIEKGGKFIQENVSQVLQLENDQTLIKSENKGYNFEKAIIAAIN